MSGSNATLQAFNLESESLPGEIRTKYRFDANAARCVGNQADRRDQHWQQRPRVNLDGFVLPNLAKLLLFDGDQALAGNRIFGTFTNLRVNGALNPPNYTVVYDQVNGDIFLKNTIPEPSTMLLLGLGMVDRVLGEASGAAVTRIVRARLRIATVVIKP